MFTSLFLTILLIYVPVLLSKIVFINICRSFHSLLERRLPLETELDAAKRNFLLIFSPIAVFVFDNFVLSCFHAILTWIVISLFINAYFWKYKTLGTFHRGWPARGPRARAGPRAGAGGFLWKSKVPCAQALAQLTGPRGDIFKGLKARAPARADFQNAQ